MLHVLTCLEGEVCNIFMIRSGVSGLFVGWKSVVSCCVYRHLVLGAFLYGSMGVPNIHC